MLSYNEQIIMIKRLQEALLPLKPFFCFLNYFDTPWFYFCLVPFIWWGLGKKIGFRFFLCVIFSGYFNLILKQFYGLPRPFEIDQNLAWVIVKGWGFPSGGAQTSFLLSCFFYSLWKDKKWSFLFFSYTGLISISRVVLGVHFITDIIMGWWVAFVLFFFYNKAYLPQEHFFFPLISRQKLYPSLLLVSIVPFLFCSFDSSRIAIFSLGSILGCYFFEEKKSVELLPWIKIIIIFTACSILFLFVQVLKHWNTQDLLNLQLIGSFFLGFSFFIILQLIKKEESN